MSYKKPDRTAKRVRKSSSVIMNYKMMKKFKDINPEYDITLKEFNNILNTFNSNIVETVINNRDGVELPERLGQLQIVAFPKPTKKIIDFAESNKYGEKRYHGNWETDNKIGKITYRNTLNGYTFKNSRFWGLIPQRSFKQRMSKVFKRKWQKYIYIDNKRK
jgi:hypothetical protein